MVGEGTKHKNSEIALAAADRAGVKIKVIGDGPDLSRLRDRYRNAALLGRVDDCELAELYATCRALVVPAVEEFGITMVEAQAAGRPVLAAAVGGALEIVADGVTGILVKPRTVDELADATRATNWESFDPSSLQASAGRPRPIPADKLATHPSIVKAAGVLAASSIVGGCRARTRHRP